MTMGFDSGLYIKTQTEQILKRLRLVSGKLYLEFGGKLFDDYHAARVLPGFDVNAKVKLLECLKDKLEIMICVSAKDIENSKIRGDFGITYGMDALRLIDNLRGMGLTVSSIVLTQFEDQPNALAFYNSITKRGERITLHRPTRGYPTDIKRIVSAEGYGANPYVETTMPIVVVTAPGPSSGKLATCLSQIYHEYIRGVKAGYAKFETFPIWNLPLKHPVNLAYEAATADLNDVNMIDPFHLEAYERTAVSYNRDIEAFPILKSILSKITPGEAGSNGGTEAIYRSPTDMGVNMAGMCITDDSVVRGAAVQEIIRRYYRTACDYKQGRVDERAVVRVEMIMSQLGIKKEDRAVVKPALLKEKEKGVPVVSLELPGGAIVTGKASELMTAPSSAVLNAIKELSGISDQMRLISPVVIEPIQSLKENTLGIKKISLNLEEILIALCICAATNPMAEAAVAALDSLKNCEAHSTHILPHADGGMMRKLRINLTSEPDYSTKDLFYD